MAGGGGLYSIFSSVFLDYFVRAEAQGLKVQGFLFQGFYNT